MIGHTGFQMNTRFLTVDKGEKKIPVLTLGAGSYICNANYENALPRNHILIGKYSSIAHGIRFVVAIMNVKRKIITDELRKIYETPVLISVATIYSFFCKCYNLSTS